MWKELLKEYKGDLRYLWYRNSDIVYMGIVFLAILVFATYLRTHPK